MGKGRKTSRPRGMKAKGRLGGSVLREDTYSIGRVVEGNGRHGWKDLLAVDLLEWEEKVVVEGKEGRGLAPVVLLLLGVALAR